MGPSCLTDVAILEPFSYVTCRCPDSRETYGTQHCVNERINGESIAP